MVSGSRSVTYGELDGESNRLAHWLRDQRCRRGDRICLLAAKGPDAILGILGILKAGAAYVPLDIDAPATRVGSAVATSEPSAILADAASLPLVVELMGSGAARPTIPVASIDRAADPETAIATGEWAEAPTEPVEPFGRPDDMAYIMFTSGSTGKPKGVVITHANVGAFVDWAVRHFEIRRGDRNSGHPPLFFDLSVFDLFGTFAAGAQVHLIPAASNLHPQAVLELIGRSQLTQWFSVPSAMTYLATHGDMDRADLSSLKRVLWCGDVLPTTTLLRWMDRLPDATFTNLYGPTETTVASSYFTVRERPDPQSSLPIGRACEGEELLVLDEDRGPIADSAVGDLYIRGVGVSPGYWRDPERTAELFVQRPASEDLPERIYRTGDLASKDEDGLFHFHGRRDFQVKSRGYRIELEEIELALNALGLVTECAVVGVLSSGFEGTMICCAYVPRPDLDGPMPPRRLRAELRATLPSYMLPSRWRALPSLPVTANGKIDRKALRGLFEGEEP